MRRTTLPIGLAVAVSGLLLLTACEVKVGQDDKADAGNGAAASSADNGGQVSLDIPGFSAKVDVPATSLGSDDMDIDGLRLYPGTRVTGVDVKAAGDASANSVRISYASADAPDKLKAYYEAAAKDKGFTSAASTREGAADVLNLTNAKGKKVRIAIEPAGTGSKGALTILD
ncbi:MAG: hypothetical protein QHC65_02635 [Sphingomonas sp.]|nr:hypothetical protein [Sphingomonas sp.]MDX3883292.1 hypothetical protein [Sphingomonas sp.]